MSPSPPNILLIVTDQQRYDSLGCTGHPSINTPHLDGLAASGGVFDRHFTAHPVCTPSRASLMTGCYPAAHGVWENGIPLPRRDGVPTDPQNDRACEHHWPDPELRPPIPSHLPTLADIFYAANYRTSAFGKLHLTPTQSDISLRYPECAAWWDQDTARSDWHGPYYGFEHVELTLGHGPLPGGHYDAWLQKNHPQALRKIRDEIDHAPRPTPLGDLYLTSHTAETHPTFWVADRVCERIRTHYSEQEPFLIWAGIPDPHHPFTPPREFAEASGAEGAPRAADPERVKTTPHWLEKANRDAAAIDPATTRAVRQFTDTMVSMIDTAVGRMLATLESCGLAENTVVVFTSDHGDYLGDYGLLRKTIYPSRVLCHTPLIVRDPEQRLAGRHPTPVSNVDLFPTLTSLAGIETPAGVQGHDLTRGPDAARSLPVMVQSANGLTQSTSLSLIEEHHRTTWWPGSDCVECFDHRTDSMELEDLAAHGVDAPVRQRLSRLQESFGRSVRPTTGRIACW